ncbi:MAG: SidA/IucD/PvdA family monooxygenase [Streptosporangiales bacterium]|nr:SidA/IucD/PvdA family monooxygenase [Streptosporangiales bacterium]
MKDLVDVVIVGAGPYGLSLAAHLRAHGVRFRHFGLPMRAWNATMPNGMFLKSQGFASNLSDPEGTHTLGAFCRSTARGYGDYGVPVPLETFTAYGRWFRQHQAPELEETLVTGINRQNGRFELTVAAEERVHARSVVIATGLQHLEHVPDVLARLPEELCSHSSVHADLGAFRGLDVVIVGAGQSALESAALLHEGGASVRVVARATRVVWNGPPLVPHRPLVERVREPEAGLGSGWSTWFYSTQPRLYRRLPSSVRMQRARTALGPAGACWLRSRVEGQFPLLLGQTTVGAEPTGDRVRLRLRTRDGEERELIAEHIVAATGFRPSVARLPFLHERLRAELRLLGGAPWVGPDFESSVAGLFFAGPAVASSFGPVMRFVYGADYAARVMSRRLTAHSRRALPVAAGARS